MEPPPPETNPSASFGFFIVSFRNYPAGSRRLRGNDVAKRRFQSARSIQGLALLPRFGYNIVRLVN
jgi:hypothetical protein